MSAKKWDPTLKTIFCSCLHANHMHEWPGAPHLCLAWSPEQSRASLPQAD